MHFRALLVAPLAAALMACAVDTEPARHQPLSETPLHGKFVWHDLITDDVEAAKAFYGGLFGWTFRDATRPGGGPYVLIVGEGDRLLGGIVEVEDGDGVDYSRWLGYISSGDVDAAAAAAERLGGRLIVAPREVGTVARITVVQDPQGAVVGYIDSHIGDPLDGAAVRPGEVAWNEILAANDLGALEFYMETAGYRANTETRYGGEYRTLESGGVARAGLQTLPNDNVQPLWLTHFAVQDPAAAAGKAGTLGGKVILEPSADIRDGEMAVVTDPTGAVLALKRL